MAAGIAHDFNNHLTAIRGYADLVRPELPTHCRAQSDLSDIDDPTTRAKTDRAADTSCRKEPLNHEQQTCTESSRNSGRCSRTSRRRIVLDFELAATPLGHADPSQLEQVIVNLVANARDAMAAAGTVTIATGDGTLVDPRESSRLGIDTRQLGSADGLRRRRGNRPRDPWEHLRPVLHDEGTRHGCRARPHDRRRNRPSISRRDRRRGLRVRARVQRAAAGAAVTDYADLHGGARSGHPARSGERAPASR